MIVLKKIIGFNNLPLSGRVMTYLDENDTIIYLSPYTGIKMDFNLQKKSELFFIKIKEDL